MKNKEKLDKAIELAKNNQNLTITQLQIEMSIGYPLAKQIYETLLKHSTDIHLAIQESFTFNPSYDRIKNFFAKNEEHLLLVKNTSSSDVTFGVGLFDIKNVDDSYTMSPNSTLLFRFGTINQLSYKENQRIVYFQ